MKKTKPRRAAAAAFVPEIRNAVRWRYAFGIAFVVVLLPLSIASLIVILEPSRVRNLMIESSRANPTAGAREWKLAALKLARPSTLSFKQGRNASNATDWVDIIPSNKGIHIVINPDTSLNTIQSSKADLLFTDTGTLASTGAGGGRNFELRMGSPPSPNCTPPAACMAN